MLASMLAGCAASTPSGSVGIHLPSLPAKLTQCPRPAVLPEAGLSRADVERIWARDRAALVRCGASLDGLVAYYEDLSRRLGAADTRGKGGV